VLREAECPADVITRVVKPRSLGEPFDAYRNGDQITRTSSTTPSDELVDYEAAGLDACSFRRRTASTPSSQLGSSRPAPAIGDSLRRLPLYTRTPALLAMTAAGLDHVSEGRFTLGIGASGRR